MSLPSIIKYDTVRAGHTWGDIATAHTCPNDGYLYAWTDRVDPSFVWAFATCPVDAVMASLKVQITNFVGFFYNYTTNPDKFIWAVNIEDSVAQWCRTWLDSTTTVAISEFLKEESRIYPLVKAEMIAQGVATL